MLSFRNTNKNRILIVADPLITVPPFQYGGTERIAYLVADYLSKNGYQVNLIAKEGSQKFNGKLIYHKIPGKSLISRIIRKCEFQIRTLKLFLSSDIVINFGRIDYLILARIFRMKVLLRFGNPINKVNVRDIEKFSKKTTKTICISKFQAEILSNLANVHVVYNGLKMELFKFSNTHNNYLAFIGILSKAKGVDIAISISKSLGIPIKLAGKIPERQDELHFFKSTIEPQFGEGVEYIGLISDSQKNEFYGSAMALLFPIREPEAFGLVMIESLACGTPVIATNKYSVPEVIKNGITGFVCNTIEEMKDAVRKINSIDRKNCRKDTEERFSQEVMVQQYIDVIKSFKS